jgi:hypothetical protein
MRDLHEHYDKLNEEERALVDYAIEKMFRIARERDIPLSGDDTAERAVDALSLFVIESRTK